VGGCNQFYLLKNIFIHPLHSVTINYHHEAAIYGKKQTNQQKTIKLPRVEITSYNNMGLIERANC
jgi:hypothetical protein